MIAFLTIETLKCQNFLFFPEGTIRLGAKVYQICLGEVNCMYVSSGFTQHGFLSLIEDTHIPTHIRTRIGLGPGPVFPTLLFELNPKTEYNLH